MADAFSTRKGDSTESTFTGNYLRSFKAGETLVRFLEEPEDWAEYREHYTLEGRAFPCTKNRSTCPGCTSENERVSKSTRKYGANVLLVKQDLVLPFKIPYTLSERLETRAQRNDGTLLNRDYTIIKTGQGLDTEYDVDQEEKYDVDLEHWRKQGYNLETILTEMFTEQWGDPGKYTGQAKAGEENQDVPPSRPISQSVSAAKSEHEDVYTEAQIRSMSKSELQELYKVNMLEYSEDDTKSELIDKLLKQFA